MSTSEPLVSVVLIFLNGERFIGEAIASVRDQTYGTWELLLVDDGSTDGSTALAKAAAAADSRISYWHHEGHRNRGKPASRNLGIAKASGGLVAFIDADDVWLPEKLARQVAMLEAHPTAALAYGTDLYWYSWDETQTEHRDYLSPLRVPTGKLLEPPRLLSAFIRGQVAVPCPTTIMVRREAAIRVGGFDDAFVGPHNVYEDQGFYAKLLLREYAVAADECWSRYRQHSDASCAVDKRSGLRGDTRDFFLAWLATYLQREGINDRGLWSAVREAQWLVRHPRIARIARAVRRRTGAGL